MTMLELASYILPGSLVEFMILCAWIAILSGVYQHIKIKVAGSKPGVGKKLPPGLFPWPVVGNAPFLGDKAHLTFHKWATRYGPIYRVKLGGVRAIVLSSMQLARSAFVAQKRVFQGRPPFPSYKHVSRGHSVVMNDVQTQGEKWRKHKSLIVRHLHKHSTSVASQERMNDVTTKETIRMIKHLQSASATKPVRPEDTVRMSVANTLSAICYGRRFDYDNKEFCELLSMNKEFGEIISASVLLDSMPWLNNISKFRKVMDDFILLNKRLDDWTAKRCEDALASCLPKSESNLVESMTTEFLEELGCDLDGLDEENKEIISALVEDVFAAGQHTTSATYFWVLTYLMKFPDVLQRIREELDDVVGDRLPRHSDSKSLPYLEAFLHEVFRHTSILSGTIPHLSLDDAEVGGYHVPRGTMVIVNQYSINNDEDVWKNPSAFDPTRFLLKIDSGGWQLNKDLVDMYSVFSLGTRKCPGDMTARRWLFLATSIVVHTCDLLLDEDRPPTTDCEYGLVLMPHYVSLKLRLKNSRGAPEFD